MTWLEVLNIVGDICIVLGALVFAICGLGVLKFRDVYTRLSVIGTAGGSGIILVVVGVWLKDPGLVDALLALGSILLLLATSAVGTILISRAALLRGTPMVEPIFDETALLPEETDAISENER